MIRGDVHAIKLPRGRGRVQHGRRYAVIVQADDLLALSTVVICPTSQSAPAASFHPEIALDGERTWVLCEMVGAVDARALGDRVEHLGFDELRTIDDALRLVLDLTQRVSDRVLRARSRSSDARGPARRRRGASGRPRACRRARARPG